LSLADSQAVAGALGSRRCALRRLPPGRPLGCRPGLCAQREWCCDSWRGLL